MFNAEDRFWSQYRHDGDPGYSAPIGLRSFALRSSRHLPGHSTTASPTTARSGFVERLEAAVAEHLAAAPEQMTIPLAKMVLVKKTGSA